MICDILELNLKSTETTLLDLKRFYDILDLDLNSTRTNLLDSDLFHCNQAGMLLEKHESTSIKQAPRGVPRKM